MKQLILFLIALLFAVHSQAQITKKALFLGNSYTYVNDLPLTLSKLASSLGDSLISNINATGGQRLSGHAGDANTYISFKKDNWDYIVLQEQSQLPSFPPSQVQSDVFPYANRLCDSIHALPNCVKPVFFMTWGRKNGDQANCKNYAPLCTYEGMQLELRKNYLTMAKTNNAYAIPVGMVWREIRRKWPSINLYTSDESHPRPEGTYAAACTFYAVLYGKSPVGASYKGGLTSAEADSIQIAANAIVFDSLKTWNIISGSIISSFSYTKNQDTVHFNYTGSLADSVSWDFGDGTSSKLNAPTHIYNTSDTFKVTVTAYKGCISSDTTKEIIVSSNKVSVRADFSFMVKHDTVDFIYTGTKADSVKWDFGNGKNDTVKSPRHIYKVTDTVNVQLTAYYSSVNDFVRKEVIVKLAPPSNVAVEKLKNSGAQVVQVVPNPVSHKALVTCNEIMTSLQILDLNGKIISTIPNVGNTKYDLDISILKAGTYLLRIETAVNVSIERIIKK